MPLSAGELARRENGTVAFRGEPLRVSWQFDHVPSNDGQLFRCTFACTLSLPPQAVERRAFSETFLATSDVVPVTAVTRHFHPALQTALIRLAGATPAEGLTESAVRDALLAAAKPIAFDCGVDLLPPAPVHLLCTSRLQQQSRAAPAAASQTETAVPSRIYAVAGTSLLTLDSADDFSAPRLVDLPTSLGPLRSVCPTREAVFVGARAGVFQCGHDGAIQATYATTATTSAHGFNSVTPLSDAALLVATHSELGVAAWDLGRPADAPAIVPLQGSRHVVPLDGASAIVATAVRLFIYEHGQTAPLQGPPSGDIVSLAESGPTLLAIYADGTVWEIERWTRQSRQSRTLPCSVAAAAISDQRLVIAADHGPLKSISLIDDSVTELPNTHIGLRDIAAFPGVIAAISPDRQRLVIWNMTDPRRTPLERHLASVARHRLVDIAIVAKG